MGFVKAGDFLEVAARTRSLENVRELCGKCVLRATVSDAEGYLEVFFKKIGWLS